MGVSWKHHFKPSNIAPKHNNPVTFVVSQWQYEKDTPGIIYLLVRLAIFIPFFVIWLLTITMESDVGRQTWLIYLTNWGFSLCVIQSCLSCVMLIGALLENRRHEKSNLANSISKIYPVYWVVNVMATTVAFTITFIYWTIIYKAEGSYWSTMNFMVHGFNSILMFFDFWVVSQPVQFWHFVYPIAVTFVYTVMTAIYFFCGGTTKNGTRYIYPILKWDEPGMTIVYCSCVVLVMIVIHTLTFFMYLLRVKIYNCCFPNPKDVNSISDPAEIRML